MDGWFDSGSEWFSHESVRVLAIIAGALVLYLIVRALFSRRIIKAGIKAAGSRVSEEQERRARTLAGVLSGVLLTLIILVAALMILSELGFSIGPLLAGAGIAGVALGFGAQTMVKDLIGGFFILMEGQYSVGDFVQVDGQQRSVAGKVESITLRTTLLRDIEGTLHIVPNGMVGIASNQTRGWARAVIDIDIYYREDIVKVFEILGKACQKAATEMETAGEITDGPEVLGVQKLAGRTMVVRVAARTTPHSRVAVGRELRGLLIRELEQNGVTLGPRVTPATA